MFLMPPIVLSTHLFTANNFIASPTIYLIMTPLLLCLIPLAILIIILIILAVLKLVKLLILVIILAVAAYFIWSMSGDAAAVGVVSNVLAMNLG